MDTYLNCSSIKNSGTTEDYGVDCWRKHMGLVGMTRHNKKYEDIHSLQILLCC